MLLIRYWRLKRGKSMAWLAKTLGVSVKTVSHWELGNRQPHPRMIPRIATALGITPGSLFPKDEQPEELVV
jgi:transcriptional regulator with XRE-family HTH domain